MPVFPTAVLSIPRLVAGLGFGCRHWQDCGKLPVQGLPQLGCPGSPVCRARALHVFPICIVSDANAKFGVSHRMHAASARHGVHGQG